MRVLVLNYEFPPLGGGASPVSYDLAKGYAAAGHEVDVVTMGFRGLPAVEKADGMTIYRVPCLRRRKERCAPWEQATYLWAAKRFLRTRFSQASYDVCHTHFLIPTGVLARWVRHRYGVPYLITAHGSDVPGYNPDRFTLLHRFTKPLIRRVCADAAFIVAPSEYLRALISERIAPETEKLVMIPNGIDPQRILPLPKENIILSTGRLLPRKGFQHLIRAVSETDIGFEVHICGDGPMRAELERLAVASKTKVVFHGWLDNKSAEYRELLGRAAVYCLASSRENASMALLEAMSAGCAVVTSDAAGCAETVGDAGIVVPAGDERALSEALRTLARDDARVAALGLAARERVLERYALDEITSRYAALCAAAARQAAPHVAYAYFTDFASPEAHGTYLLNSISALRRHAPTDFIIGWVPRARVRRILDFNALPQDMPVTRMPIFLTTRSLPLEKVARAAYSLLALIALRFSKARVIVTSDFGLLYFLSYVPRWLRPRALVLFDQCKIYHRASEKVSVEQERRALRAADGFIAISPGVKEDLEKIFGVPEDRIVLAPTGANLALFNAARRDRAWLETRYGIAPDELVAVYSGSFLEWKGVETLVRAVKHLKTRPAKILIIGGSGARLSAMRALARSEGVEDVAVISGQLSVRDVATVLKSADIGVIPNIRMPEGERYTSPLKLFEYLASGLPIVAARLPSLQSMLADERNARFFEPENERDLAAALDALFEDAAARSRMSAQNAQDAAQYSYETRAVRVLAFAARLLSAHSS